MTKAAHAPVVRSTAAKATAPPKASKPAAVPPTAPSRSANSPSTALAAAVPATAGSDWGFLVSPRWLIGLAAVSLLSHTAAFYWFRLRKPEPPPVMSREMPLGTYEFSRFSSRENHLNRGQFDIFLRLADHLSTSQWRQIEREEHQLQQAAEEALRRLRSADFNDPHFVRLKDHIQERLNDELGFEGVAEVIVSNLTAERAAQDKPPTPSDAPSEAKSPNP
jgi:hypothetical protein